MSDALISDPEVQESYHARAPQDLPSSSAQKINSGMNRGMVFAETDGAATDRMVAFLKGAHGGAEASNYEAHQSGRRYLEGDRMSEAAVKSVSVPVLDLRRPFIPPPSPAANPSVVSTPRTPVLGGI